MKKILLIVISIFLFFPEISAQKHNCKKFHLYSDCNVNPGPRFNFDGQSRSNIIGFGDQLIYSMVLYGGKQYKIYFCTSDYFKPIHIQIIDTENNDVLYDNKTDEYLSLLTLNIDETQRIKFSLEVLAHDMPEEERMEYFGCLGMMVQSKKLKD